MNKWSLSACLLQFCGTERLMIYISSCYTHPFLFKSAVFLHFFLELSMVAALLRVSGAVIDFAICLPSVRLAI